MRVILKRIILSVDDAAASDLRVAHLAKKYDIVTIFYWPADMTSVARQNGFKPLTPQNANIIAKEFEIGSHTITHRHLTRIPEHEAKWEIAESKTMLEDLYDIKVTKFAPPRGYITEPLSEFAYTIYDKIRLTKGKDLVHIHPKSGANNNKDWKVSITDDTTELWCHSWELDKFNLWGELEKFLRERS